jgi:hypothetical protein
MTEAEVGLMAEAGLMALSAEGEEQPQKTESATKAAAGRMEENTS